VGLTVTDVKEELTNLLRVTVADPKWSQTRLLDLPLVERQFEASRQYGLRSAQANLNLAVCLLQSVNQLMPASPAPRFYDTWKMLIGAELNCLGAVRGYVAGELPPAKTLDSVQGVLRECASQRSFSAPEIARAKPHTLKDMVRGAITALWLWKTGQSPFVRPQADWEALLNEFSGEGIWTRDVTLKQRGLFISELAQYLVSERAKSQPVGLGPQVFEAVGTPPPTPAALAGESDSSSASAALRQDTVTQSTSSPTSPSSNAAPTSILNESPSALDSYQRILDQQYPAITGYRPPACRYTARGTSQDIKTDADVQRLLENPTVLISGMTGIGKTTYLTQVIMPACRELGLAPLFIALPEYFAVRDKLGDLPTFLREKVFGQVHTAAEQKDQFTHELAAAIFQQSVIWLLDGFDELTPPERGLLVQELARLNRFVLTTRQVKPEASRPFEATGHLQSIDYRNALEYISACYSPHARSCIEQWCERQYEARDVLSTGWWLEQTAEFAADPAQVLNLSAVLDRAISRRLSTRARFQHTGSTDYYALARAALRSLAFESLGLNRVNDEDPQHLTLSQVTYAWRRRSPEPESIFLEIIGSTGLLLQKGEHWRVPAELVRDELTAEFMESEGFLQANHLLYPQVERPIGFWAARLMRSNQVQQVVDLLTTLRNLNDDPYSARWSVVVRVLTECHPFENDRLREIQLETERALLDWWHATSSNKMKWQINLWLYAIGSQQIPEMRSGMLETALRDLDSLRPKCILPELLQQASHAELARRVDEGGRIDQQAVTQALIDIIADGPVGLVNDAAIHLAPRNLEPTMLAKLGKDSPIDRLAELARTQPMNQYVTPQHFKRAQAAQSAALGILGRPIVLANEALLKRIPADVIHSLMADLHLRIRKANNRITVITADGRGWLLKAGE
jgi:hypothetical protein